MRSYEYEYLNGLALATLQARRFKQGRHALRRPGRRGAGVAGCRVPGWAGRRASRVNKFTVIDAEGPDGVRTKPACRTWSRVRSLSWRAGCRSQTTRPHIRTQAGDGGGGGAQTGVTADVSNVAALLRSQCHLFHSWPSFLLGFSRSCCDVGYVGGHHRCRSDGHSDAQGVRRYGQHGPYHRI